MRRIKVAVKPSPLFTELNRMAITIKESYVFTHTFRRRPLRARPWQFNVNTGTVPDNKKRFSGIVQFFFLKIYGLIIHLAMPLQNVTNNEYTQHLFSMLFRTN